MYFYAYNAINHVVFWENLHSWHKFYTAAGHDGRDKSQHCLACEDPNSKLVEVVNAADVDDEDRIDNSLLLIWKLRLGQDFEVEVQTRL